MTNHLRTHDDGTPRDRGAVALTPLADLRVGDTIRDIQGTRWIIRDISPGTADCWDDDAEDFVPVEGYEVTVERFDVDRSTRTDFVAPGVAFNVVDAPRVDHSNLYDHTRVAIDGRGQCLVRDGVVFHGVYQLHYVGITMDGKVAVRYPFRSIVQLFDAGTLGLTIGQRHV